LLVQFEQHMEDDRAIREVLAHFLPHEADDHEDMPALSYGILPPAWALPATIYGMRFSVTSPGGCLLQFLASLASRLLIQEARGLTSPQCPCHSMQLPLLSMVAGM
jgi:hypothetical protein